jgi:hypothetical protein
MTEIFWITAMSIILGGAFVKMYFLGHSRGFDRADNINERIENGITALQGDRADLEAMACVSSGKCRRTPKEYTKELLIRIARKSYDEEIEAQLKGEADKYYNGQELMQAKEISDTCDCGDGCEACQTAEDEQDETEAREEVEENTPYLLTKCFACLGEPPPGTGFVFKDNHAFCSDKCKEHYIACKEAEEAYEEEVTEANQEAAENDTGNLAELEKRLRGELAESIKHYDRPVTASDIINRQLVLLMGVSEKDVADFKWQTFSDCMVATHPNYKPIIRTKNSGKLRFMEAGEAWPESEQDKNIETAQEKMGAVKSGDEHALQIKPESGHESSVDAGATSDDLKTNEGDRDEGQYESETGTNNDFEGDRGEEPPQILDSTRSGGSIKDDGHRKALAATKKACEESLDKGKKVDVTV